MSESSTELLETPLTGFHAELGAKMTGFAGYAMPLQYSDGVMAEHRWTRSGAGLFDVSHMGQIAVRHEGGAEGAARALETLVPVDLVGLAEMRQRYGFFTNDAGGLLDDLMIARHHDHLVVVANAACKAADLAHMNAHLPDCEITLIPDRALIALQGPKAEAVLGQIAPVAKDMNFQDVRITDSAFGALWITRSGYTGEDGFEISVVADQAEALARGLLEHPDAAPIGLGARDTLRLEAGLCLYGQDITPDISPVEAGLKWAIGKARRTGGVREAGFPGAGRILSEISNGTDRVRVGLRPEGRAPTRQGTAIFAQSDADTPVGEVTSGAFGPTLEAPVAIGYVPRSLASPGQDLWGEVRGKRLPVRVAPLPFTPANFKRATTRETA
ncbi:MAG: glycine cleavage system aminomethyltransferase GcvT [Pseudomonadota bacterium]